MKYDYFISSRWKNRDVVLDLTDKLRSKGKKVYCFFENKYASELADQNPEETMKNFESKTNWTKDRYVKGVFEEDMQGLKNSRILILILPAGKSCHIEAGIAYGMGKRCILIGEQKEAESLYLIFSEFHKDTKSFLKTI